MFHLKDSNQCSLRNECEHCCCKPRNLKYCTETNPYLAPDFNRLFVLKKRNGKEIVDARFERKIYNILVSLKSQIQLLG